MQIYSSLDSTNLNGVWLTIGSFDGVHRGHQEIIRQLVSAAHSQSSPAVVLTFYPHPAVVLRGLTDPFYLTTPEERASLMEDLDVDNVVIQRFDRQLAGTSARDFVMKLKKHLGFQQLLVGQGFALGHGREGDVPTLQRLGAEFGFGVSVHPPVLLDGLAISSSQIRSALAAGNVERASQLLGRPYRVAGEVVQGDARGQMIGIPTANLQTWPEQLMPAVGVYACLARIGETVYQAATNIGMRPTFEGLDTVQYLEAHLLDFHGNLYGQKMQLDFLARLRDEEKFDTVQALVEKIQQDIAQTREILTRAQS